LAVVERLPWELRLELVEDLACTAIAEAEELLRRHETVRPERHDRCVRNDQANPERTARELRL